MSYCTQVFDERSKLGRAAEVERNAIDGSASRIVEIT